MRERGAAKMRSLVQVLIGVLLAAAAGIANGADIKIATLAPDNSRWMQQMREGAEEVKARTAGRVTLKFYPGGVMGNDAQVLRKIRIGQLQGGAFTAGGLSERYPGLNVYGVPLLFRSLDEVDAVRKQLDPELAAGLEQAGFVSFGFIEGGFANLLSNEPISTVEDMRRKKVWVPEGDNISFLAMQTMGLSPSVLPVTDVLTGLQTGLIDITFASPVAALVLLVKRVVPAIPVVARNRKIVTLLRIGRIASHDQSLTRTQPVGFAANVNLRLTGAHSHFGMAVIVNSDAVGSLLIWTNRKVGCADFGLRVRAIQHPECQRP